MSGLRAKFLFPSFWSFLPILFQLRFCNNCYFEVNLVSSRSCCNRHYWEVTLQSWISHDGIICKTFFCFMFHWNKRNVLIWVQKTTHGDENVIMMICVGKAASSTNIHLSQYSLESTDFFYSFFWFCARQAQDSNIFFYKSNWFCIRKSHPHCTVCRSNKTCSVVVINTVW